MWSWIWRAPSGGGAEIENVNYASGTMFNFNFVTIPGAFQIWIHFWQLGTIDKKSVPQNFVHQVLQIISFMRHKKYKVF